MEYKENQLVMESDGDCVFVLIERLPKGYWKVGGLDDRAVTLHEDNFRKLTKEEMKSEVE